MFKVKDVQHIGSCNSIDISECFTGSLAQEGMKKNALIGIYATQLRKLVGGSGAKSTSNPGNCLVQAIVRYRPLRVS